MSAVTHPSLGLRTWVAVLVTMLVAGSTPEAGAVLRVGPGQTFATVQAAVDASESGDTVLVYPSDYPESVLVSKSDLTLAAQAPGTTVGPPPNMGQACFEVKADGVVIQGFDLTGSNCAPAIRFEGSLNRFADNRIFSLTCPGVNAIACRAPDGGSNDNIIENNDITQADLGIVIGSDSKVAVNKRNIVRGNHIHGVYASAIAIYNGIACEVTGNTIEGVDSGLGISIATSGSKTPQHSHLVAGNAILGATECGIGLFSDGAGALTKVTVSNNSLDSPGEFGIVLQKDPGARLAENVLSANRISRAAEAGILLDTGVNQNRVESNLVLACEGDGIRTLGNRNRVRANASLDNEGTDLVDGGRGNAWKDNTYETASW